MKRTYTVAREGFLMNSYKNVGDTVYLHERQAFYLVLSGQLADPDKPVIVEPIVAPVTAGAKD